jgi:hypothetical protein
MLLGCGSNQTNRRIAPVTVKWCVFCVGLFPALLWGQISPGDGAPTAAGSVETPPHPGQSAAFSSTTPGFAPELNPIRASVLRSEVPRRGQPSRGLWIASIVVLAGANMADARSSWNKDDASRTLVGSQGKFGTKGALIKCGINSLWVVGQFASLRKNPAHRRLLAIVNFAAASVFAVVAYRNSGIAGPGAGPRQGR